MISNETKSVIQRAKELYVRDLQTSLEAEHSDRFIAIEPDSGEYFLGDTFDMAVKAARMKYSDRITHTIHIGHSAAFHIGVLQL